MTLSRVAGTARKLRPRGSQVDSEQPMHLTAHTRKARQVLSETTPTSARADNRSAVTGPGSRDEVFSPAAVFGNPGSTEETPGCPSGQAVTEKVANRPPDRL
jgi:hypothetical protein